MSRRDSCRWHLLLTITYMKRASSYGAAVGMRTLASSIYPGLLSVIWRALYVFLT